MDENNQGLQWSHIEPLCILRALARQLWMLLLAALTCAMAAWIVLTCFVTQQSTSSTTFSVTTRTSNLYYTNITAAADVAASYSQLLQSRVLRQTMEQNLGMPLDGTVSAQQLGETNLIRVTVTADTPRQALVLLKAVSDNYGTLSAHVSSTAVLSQLNAPTLSVAPSRSYNVPKICLLAGVIGAEVGCSRPVAENNKWLPKAQYMGITGVQVKPDLIITLGVSGQVQHIGGINKSKVVVAINKDKAAPIFKNADFGLVGDMYKIVPALIEKLS